MRKVIVFGDLPIATKIVMFLQNLGDIEIGVVIGNKNPNNNDPWQDVPLLYDYCVDNDITMYSLDDIATNFETNELTLGLSCRFSKILKNDVISKFNYGIINTHGGLIPEFAGLYSANHTILTNSKVGGGTIHYIDLGIDTGKIIKRCEFQVTHKDTSYTVFQKTQVALEKGMEEVIPIALNGYIDAKEYDKAFFDSHVSNYYKRDSISGLKEISKDELFTEKGNRIIRAFDFPGYEPSYYVDDKGNRIYLRVSY